MKKIDTKGLLFGLDIFSKQKSQLLSELGQSLSHSRKTIFLFTPNAEQLVLSKNDNSFKNCLKQGDILIPDGMGLVLASKVLNLCDKAEPIEERITGVGVVKSLLHMAGDTRLKIMLIGGRDYQNSRFNKINDFFDNKKSGSSLMWLPGYQDIKKPIEEETKIIVKAIQKEKPDIIFVAFGAPWQEQWIIDHKDLLNKTGVKLAMAVGGSFDFILGKVNRAPVWMQAIGLEWLYRLIKEPWRWKRQLKLLEFIRMIFAEIHS